VVKNDPDFAIPPGFIDLPNADALASTSASDPPKQKSCTGFQKYATKLAVYGVVRIIQHKVSVIR
jgi:hypothetical protein